MSQSNVKSYIGHNNLLII